MYLKRVCVCGGGMCLGCVYVYELVFQNTQFWDTKKH